LQTKKLQPKIKDDLLCCSLQISFYYSFADKLQFGIINYSQKTSFWETREEAVFSSAGKKCFKDNKTGENMNLSHVYVKLFKVSNRNLIIKCFAPGEKLLPILSLGPIPDKIV
jgi:hypothetical protein